MDSLLKILITAVAVLIATYLLPNVHVDNVFYAILLAFVLAALNALVKPVLIFLTLPVTLVTFGLFLLVINAGIILLADYLIDGFKVKSFWWALLFSIVLSFINGILNNLLKTRSKNEFPGRSDNNYLN